MGGGPRIVGPGCISGENTWTFPNVSFFASGAQLELDTAGKSNTDGGSQQTLRTQLEKVIIFSYWRGVPTDLLDV